MEKKTLPCRNNIMNEKEWTEKICDILNNYFKENKVSFHACTQKKLPYAKEIHSFDQNWTPTNSDEIKFETDLFIYEEIKDIFIPRIVIESKFKNISTHDAITYSAKATEHKSIMPFLRYGIMIGNIKDEALPWRLFNHGENFDFMYCFKGEEVLENEKKEFTELITSEIEESKKLEKLLGTKGSKAGIHLLEKKLDLK